MPSFTPENLRAQLRNHFFGTDRSPHKNTSLEGISDYAIESYLIDQFTAYRTALTQSLKDKKRIMWNDDHAQHIRNIQHNETIDEVLDIINQNHE